MTVATFSNFTLIPTAMLSFDEAMDRLTTRDDQVRPWTPAVDIFETDNELVFRADAPHGNLGHIEVEVENGTLTLKGDRSIGNGDRAQAYLRMERSDGSFARSFTLPETVDADSAHAEYAYGVLTITMAKKAVAKARAIKVNLGTESVLAAQASAT
jgi:HSP20 family protein